MNYIDVVYADKTGSSINVYATKYPNIPAASEKIEEIEVPGRDGKLHKRTGKYNSTEIPVEFNYIEKKDLWSDRWRKVKEWLSAVNSELKFSDDPGYFFKVQRVIVNENERMSRRTGRFTAIFQTLDGLMYMESGTYEKEVNEVRYNPGIECHPKYYLEGEGLCDIVINGKTVTVNISEHIIIDTDLMIAYKNDKTTQNTALKGKYEDLYLQKGDNEISVTEGFVCKITPNWRCL